MAAEAVKEELTYDSPSAFMNAVQYDDNTLIDFDMQHFNQAHQLSHDMKSQATGNHGADPALSIQFPSFNLDSNMWGNHGHLNRIDMLNASMSPLDATFSYDTGYASQENSPDNKSPPGIAPPQYHHKAESKAAEAIVATPKPRKRSKLSTSTSAATTSSKKEPKQTPRKARRVSKLTQEEEDMLEKMEGMDDAKREQFLARNREAASKCRQKKKVWTSNLEERARELSFEKQMLTTQAAMLKNELLMLKCKCLEHSNCDCESIREYLKHTVTNLPPANAALYSRVEEDVAASRKGSLESTLSLGTHLGSGDEDLDFLEIHS